MNFRGLNKEMKIKIYDIQRFLKSIKKLEDKKIFKI